MQSNVALHANVRPTLIKIWRETQLESWINGQTVLGHGSRHGVTYPSQQTSSLLPINDITIILLHD